jgi:hypothetical protein
MQAVLSEGTHAFLCGCDLLGLFLVFVGHGLCGRERRGRVRGMFNCVDVQSLELGDAKLLRWGSALMAR